MKDYVLIPDTMLEDLEVLVVHLNEPYNHVMLLPPE